MKDCACAAGADNTAASATAPAINLEYMSHFLPDRREIGRTRSRGQPIQTTHSRKIRMPGLRKRAALALQQAAPSAVAGRHRRSHHGASEFGKGSTRELCPAANTSRHRADNRP
jgi:hypothetical protein